MEMDGRVDGLRFFVLFNSISLISGQWAGDNQWAVCKETPPESGIKPGIATSVRQHLTY